MSLALKVRLAFAVCCFLAPFAAVPFAWLDRSETSSRHQREQVIFRDIDRENTVFACMDASQPLNDRLVAYADHFVDDEDRGARYFAAERALPAMPICNSFLLRQGDEPWNDVAQALDDYAATRRHLIEVMRSFRAAVANGRSMDQEVDASASAIADADADAAMSYADVVLHDALYPHSHHLAELAIAELSLDPARSADAHVARIDDAADQVRFALHHLGNTAASRSLLAGAVAHFHDEVAAFPREGGRVLFVQRARELDAALAVVSTSDINVINGARSQIARLESALADAYDQVSPRIGG